MESNHGYLRIEHLITELLEEIGEDPDREGLQETPHRVAKAWAFWTGGYSEDPATIFKEFQDGGEKYDEMIIVTDIPFYSHCEHHLAPFFGVAHIAYVPKGKILGLSKMPRLVDMYARRLQVQERLTAQIADALWEHLTPDGVAVSIEARHLCIESRGIQKQNSITITNAMHGIFKTDAAARHEFLSSVRK